MRKSVIHFCKGVFILAMVMAAMRGAAQTNEFRALWVDAWGTGFLNASQATALINHCRTYNFNAVVVQMRRRGDSFYTNTLAGNDPKTTAISSSYDALADLLAKARTGSPRIEVHCWVTTFPVWSSETSSPSQSNHVFNLHPEYLTQNLAGERFNGEGYYMDPGHPDATLWNYKMATNIVRRYDVDGFHWDYIRYPQPDSGYNPTAIARYNAEFGLTGQPSSSNTQFSNWRRRQVTDFLRWANSEMLSIRSNLVISCAVFGSRSDAFNARFQDWAAWNNEGIIDICMPMGYTADNSLFQSRVTDSFSNQGVRRVYQGQGAYLNAKENTLWQLNYIRNKPLLGSVLYSYRTPNSGTADITGTLAYLRDNHQPTWVNVPVIPWKATPTKGIVRGTVTRVDNSAAVYNATITINTAPSRTQKTEPHGKFAFFETTPGTYTITATATDLGVVTTNITISAGTNFAINLALPLDSTPPIISNVGTSNLTDTAVTIRWTTDENSTSAVDYGLTTSYGNIVSNGTMTISHTVNLTNLSPNTTYNYRVRSRNAVNLQTTSASFTFTSNPFGLINDVIVESRLSNGSLNGNPPYTDSGFNDSTLKSSAPPLSGSTNQGARYAVSGTPNFTVKPNLLVAGGSYDVFLSHGSAASVSDNIIAAVTQTDCTGLPATTTALQQSGANTWELLGRMTLNSNISVPTLKFTYSSGTLDALGNGRMYSDSAKFVYVPPPQPPTITNHPPGRVVNLGANTIFTVGASGAMPMSYQWRRDGTNISGATLSSYTINNVQSSHEADYSVAVTNAAGADISDDAFLLVNLPPSIGIPPENQTATQGNEVTFSVSVGGTEPFQYQWKFNGTNIVGATESSYTRFSIQTNEAGLYSVFITNMAGSASGSATLIVTPSVPLKIDSVSLLPDGKMRLQVSGDTGNYSIDGATDFGNWTELTNMANTNGTFEFIDPATNLLRRFYRARSPD